MLFDRFDAIKLVSILRPDLLVLLLVVPPLLLAPPTQDPLLVPTFRPTSQSTSQSTFRWPDSEAGSSGWGTWRRPSTPFYYSDGTTKNQ